jgi:hypothetical protein
MGDDKAGLPLVLFFGDSVTDWSKKYDDGIIPFFQRRTCLHLILNARR